MKQAFFGWAGAALVCAATATGCAQGDANDLSARAPTSDAGLSPEADAGSDAEPPFAACATSTTALAKSPVFLELVVDASGSMKGDKWTALVGALDGIFDEMQTQADDNLGVGMLVFSDTKDATIGTGPYPVYDADGVNKYSDVPIAFMSAAQHDALRRRVDPPVNASLVTPTLAALTGGFSVLESLVPPSPLPASGRKVLVLLTDGMPSDDGNDESHPLVAHERALTAPTGPILTFPVAIGSFDDIDPVWMGTLAVNGGTAFAGCNPKESVDPKKLCYFQVVPYGKSIADLTAEFMRTLKQVRAQSAACELDLSTTAADADPSHVNVVLRAPGGAETIVPQDASDGWTYDDPTHPTKVILHGAACASAAADVDGEVEVVFGCKTVLR